MPFHTVELKEQNGNGKKVLLAFSSTVAAEFFPIGKTFLALELLDVIMQAKEASFKSLNKKVKGMKSGAVIMKTSFGTRITEGILEKAVNEIQLGKRYLVTRSEEA